MILKRRSADEQRHVDAVEVSSSTSSSSSSSIYTDSDSPAHAQQVCGAHIIDSIYSMYVHI